MDFPPVTAYLRRVYFKLQADYFRTWSETAITRGSDAVRVQFQLAI